MRPFAAIAVVALALAGLADEPKKDPKPKAADWVKVSDPGKFEIEFPGQPTERATPAGTQYTLQMTTPSAVLMATAAPLLSKIDLTDDKAVKVIFDNAVKSTKEALGGKIVSDKESKLGDKFPTREVDLETPLLGNYRARWVLTDKGFMQVVVSGTKEFVDGADAKRFRDSFKVTAKE